MTSMLKSGRSKATSCLASDGCSCCNTKADRRVAKRPAKRLEKRQWKSTESKAY